MNDSILIASDHGGLALKTLLIEANPHLNFKDLGTADTTSVDYPDFAHELCKQLLSGDYNSKAVLICGSGQGMAMTANKYPEIRAALCWDTEVAALSRQHNNANILCLGARLIEHSLAQDIFKTFFETKFENGRHAPRVEKIKGL